MMIIIISLNLLKANQYKKVNHNFLTLKARTTIIYLIIKLIIMINYQITFILNKTT